MSVGSGSAGNGTGRRRRADGSRRITVVIGAVLAMLAGCIAMATSPASATDAVLANVSSSITVGSSPRQVVVNSDGSKAYVANANSSSISVMDTATNSVTATISTGAGTSPEQLVLTRDDSKLFVAFVIYDSGYPAGGGYVEINTATNTVSYTSDPLDYIPSGIAVSADGTTLFINTYLTNQCDPFGCYYDYLLGGIRMISTSSRAGLGWLPMDGNSSGMTLSPDGLNLYVVDPGPQELLAINPADGNPRWRVSVYSDGPRIAVSPDNSTVYAASGSYLAIVDAENQSLIDVKSITNSGTGIALSPDGSYLYLSDTWGPKVRVISTSGFSVAATVTLPSGSQPWGLAANPDGSAVYVASKGAGAVKVLSAAPPVTAPAAPTSLSATPGNGSGSISFTAGADGGASISNYEYQLDGGSWTALSPADTISPVTIPGLTNGTTYSVKLRAVNTAGAGTASSAVSLTPVSPVTVPDAPTSLTATPGDGSGSISFTAGADGGASISNYEYQLDGGSWTALSPADTTSPVTIPGLTNGTTYSVKLRAVNTAGAGTASSAVSVEPAPTGPSPCSMWGVGKYSLQTCWNPLVPAQGKVNRYRAYVFTAGTTTKLASCKGSAADTGCVVKGSGKLTAATDYDVVVRARVEVAPHQVIWSLYSAPVRVSTNP